jgi:AraC-like DNA-binding protein
MKVQKMNKLLKPTPAHGNVLNFCEFEVPYALQLYIKSFFYMEVNDSYFSVPEPGPAYERIIPFGCIDIIIQSNPSFYLYESKSNREMPLPQIFFTPLLTRPIHIRPGGNTKIYGIRIQPWAHSIFLGTNVHQKATQPFIKSTVIDILYTIAHDLFTENSQNSIQFLGKKLQDYLANVKTPDPDIFLAVSQIIKYSGALQFQHLVSATKVTQRRMEQKFLQHVGLPQKLFARIVRFQNVFQMLQQQPTRMFTKVVYSCGYYDQAHFIRDFKEFSGLTPRQYFNERHMLSDVFLKPGTSVFLLSPINKAA